MNNHYPFELPQLNYAHDALEPFIDKATMEIHHGKHLQAYVDNLNNALKDHVDLHNWPLEKLLYNLSDLPAGIQGAVRNNGGGVFNHKLYFETMKKDTTLSGDLLAAIEKAFGSVDEFKAQFKAAGLTQFGSGWAWLLSDKDGNLSIEKTPNQDTLVSTNKTPIIAVDVWEHAYYLLRQNRRPEYLDNYFSVINWDAASTNYANRSKTDYANA